MCCWSRKNISPSNFQMSLNALICMESYYFHVYSVFCDVHFRYSDDAFMWTAYVTLPLLWPSHLSASTLRSVPARIMTCQCLRFCHLSRHLVSDHIVFTRSRHPSFGLPRFLFPSTSICNIFLVASSLFLLCTCPNHLNLFFLRNSVIGYTCASLQMSTFLTWSSLVFPLGHRSMRISVVCNFLSSFRNTSPK